MRAKKSTALSPESRALLMLDGKEPVVSTEVLANGFGVTHQAILKLIEKYGAEFAKITKVGFEIRPSAKNQTIRYCTLNEAQATFLGTLLRNNDRTVGFKLRLTHEFFRMKTALGRILAQKQNAEYLDRRASGKLVRRQETEAIKRFVKYASDQGSKSANRYYAVISMMANRALFFVCEQFRNLRESLSIEHLATLESADRICARALEEGMERGLGYKEIFRLAKKRLEAFAEAIGKSPVSISLPGASCSVGQGGAQ